jgi:DNA-binding Lrp family transcriptional regulator
MALKNKDLGVLVELRKNARAQLTEISKNTGIPISTIYDRIKTKFGTVIERCVALLDFEKLGYNARANVCIKCGGKSKEDVLAYLQKSRNVNSLCKVNNGFDFMAEVIFRNVRDLEEFVDSLEEKYSIKQRQVYYVIQTVKKEDFFTDKIDLILLED